MSFDVICLSDLIANHGPVARVVVAAVQGSAPRETGAAMIVWPGGQDGTIGGGTLEWEAAEAARKALAAGVGMVRRYPLGPALGQCCGGAVTLVTEIFESAPVADTAFARPLPGIPESPRPLAISRAIARARREGHIDNLIMSGDWIAEPITAPKRHVRIYGAGHVGLAIAGVLAPLRGIEVHLVDDRTARFDAISPGVIPHKGNPADAVAFAPDTADHLVLTYSHALDLEICHRILSRPFASAGLIGSHSKARRFRTRLAQLGHGADVIARLTCPIGDPALGKEPQAIAISVAHHLIAGRPAGLARRVHG